MVQKTFGQIKAALAETAGVTGMPVTDARLLRYVNNAIQELMAEGDWPGVVDRWYFRFDETTGLIALPYFMERLLGVTVNDVPKEIRSPWFEFCQYGPGVVRDEETDNQGNTRWRRVNWNNIVLDRGESPLQKDIPLTGGPYKLRVYATEDEAVGGVNPVINLQGPDVDGQPIRVTDGTAYSTGEDVAIDFTTGPQTTVNDFYGVTAVAKPATNAPVLLYAVDGAGVETLVATYAFNETSPSFRRYFIPSLYRSETGVRDRIILARCRRKFFAVAEDDDRLLIGNELALSEMMIAQERRRQDDFEAYVAHKQTAVDLMKKEALAHTGKSRVPSLTFQRGFPMGEINPMR